MRVCVFGARIGWVLVVDSSCGHLSKNILVWGEALSRHAYATMKFEPIANLSLRSLIQVRFT